MKLARVLVVVAVTVGLASCSQPEVEIEKSPAAEITPSTKATAKSIRKVLEDKGMECSKQKQLPNGVVSGVECQRSDPALVFITMQKFDDTKQLDDTWAETGAFLCEEKLTSGQIWGISGKWALVAGGYNDEHRSLLKEVSQELGFKLKEADCKEFA